MVVIILFECMSFSGLNLRFFVDMLVAVARNFSGNCIVTKKNFY